MTSLRKSVTNDRDRYEKLRQTLDKLKGDSSLLPRMIDTLQQRPARLLETIARGRPENLLLEEIGQEGDTVRISGISLDSLSANVLAAYLEDHLTGYGWEIGTPAKKSMQAFEDGGPWEFTIALRDLGGEGLGK